jgi:hypothetical protein
MRAWEFIVPQVGTSKGERRSAIEQRIHPGADAALEHETRDLARPPQGAGGARDRPRS